jgi:hypothetical protein
LEGSTQLVRLVGELLVFKDPTALGRLKVMRSRSPVKIAARFGNFVR